MQKQASATTLPDRPEDIREVLPFFVILTVVLIAIYIWSVFKSPALQEPIRFSAFTLLMLSHTGLHWTSPYLAARRKWFLPYYLVQGTLAFVITWLAGDEGLAMGLYLGLVGETIGVLEDIRSALLPIAGYLALSFVTYLLLNGWQGLNWWVLAVGPTTIFVVVYVYMFVRQARERERAETLVRELGAAHRQLSEYAAQVEDLTLANERQRMARELHDTLAQGLAGLILQLEALQAQLGKGDTQKAIAIAGQASDRARAALTQARGAIDNLRAQPGSFASVAESIEQEAGRFSAATGIPCSLDVVSPIHVSPERAEPLVRFVSEGLTNIARHASASNARISILERDGQVTAEVCDDGAGFEPQSQIEQSGHYGLLGLRERARLAGGRLDIESAPGRGTVLRLSLPSRE